MSVKVEHRLIIPRTASVIQSCVLRVIIRRKAARPAASVFLPDCRIIHSRLANRNPCSFPVENTKHTDIICRLADITDHGSLTLYGCRIAFNQIVGTLKAVPASVSILRSITIRCLCDHNLFAVIFLNICRNGLHILIRAVPERIIG